MTRALTRRHVLGLGGGTLGGLALGGLGTLALTGCSSPERPATKADLIVYGATAAGLVAAIQARGWAVPRWSSSRARTSAG